MLHKTKTQFDYKKVLTTSKSGAKDDQGDNDDEEVRQTVEEPLIGKSHTDPGNKVCQLHARHQSSSLS
jgi:hypothetical protein